MKLEFKASVDYNKRGGSGAVVMKDILSAKELGDHGRLFAQVTLDKDCSIGVHEHVGNTETYYVVSGKGIYTDDGEVYEIAAGDTTFCEDGHTHGIAQTGDEPLVFIALILNS